MTPTIYLASPIDQGTLGAVKQHAKDQLLLYGCAVFDPASGWMVPALGTPNRSLQRGNFALMRQCQGVLAILRPDILTIGVILEIEEAINLGMPVVVIGMDLRPSWSLAYLGVPVYTSTEEAIESLLEGMRDAN